MNINLSNVLQKIASRTTGAPMRAKIPFSFACNGMQMPAGSYELGYGALPLFAKVRHAVTGKGFVIPVWKTRRVQLDRSVLVFELRETGYVLSAVADKATGNALTMRKPECAAGWPYTEAMAVPVIAG